MSEFIELLRSWDPWVKNLCAYCHKGAFWNNNKTPQVFVSWSCSTRPSIGRVKLQREQMLPAPCRHEAFMHACVSEKLGTVLSPNLMHYTEKNVIGTKPTGGNRSMIPVTSSKKNSYCHRTEMLNICRFGRNIFVSEMELTWEWVKVNYLSDDWRRFMQYSIIERGY